MRGRTLNDAFIVLDEAQNTSVDQMKMFLTRLGFGARMVVTGDVTQVDLPGGTTSGLRVVQEILGGVDDVSFCWLTSADVVRHRLVSDIIDAYARWDTTRGAAADSAHSAGRDRGGTAEERRGQQRVRVRGRRGRVRRAGPLRARRDAPPPRDRALDHARRSGHD